MDGKVEVSRGWLAALVASLVSCLLALAFILGRLTAPPAVSASSGTVPALPVAVAVTSPSSPKPEATAPTLPLPRPASMPQKAPVRAEHPQPDSASPPKQVAVVPQAVAPPVTSSLPPQSRQTQVASVQVPKAQPSVATPPRHAAHPKAVPAQGDGGGDHDNEAIRHYLGQVDAAMAGTASMGDANSFATELLQQSMNGDSSGFDQLLDSSRAALRTLKAIKPPSACAEHYKLTVGQLREGVALLDQVKKASTSLDASSLSRLSLQGKDLQANANRLQELERKLRSAI